MKTKKFDPYIRGFFQDYLIKQKGVSQNTMWGYKKTIKLLRTFASAQNKKSVNNLTLKDLAPKMISAFLDNLEKQPNGIHIRDVRLSYIHSFFRYVSSHGPQGFFNQSHQILAIPFKYIRQNPTINYLEAYEMEAILQAIAPSNLDGLRNYTLFTLMYNTGARAQEVISLPVKELQLDKAFQVRFSGRGGKERVCPIWPVTAKLLRTLLNQRKLDSQADVPIFVNHSGQPLTRHGVQYLLTKYAKIAATNCPSLERKRIYPDLVRTATVINLLRSGVDSGMICACLENITFKTILLLGLASGHLMDPEKQTEDALKKFEKSMDLGKPFKTKGASCGRRL